MKKILVAGLGNVLCGDDGIGPYVAQAFLAAYRVDASVEVADLGTPGLDLIDYLAGSDVVILVDAVKCEQSPGTVLLYRKPELLEGIASPRTVPHAPSLSETIAAMELLGNAPADLLLIGVAAKSCAAGCGLSEAVLQAVHRVMDIIASELIRSGAPCEPRQGAPEPDAWWMKPPSCC